MTKSALLRSLLRRPGLVPMVGAHDALSARLIEAAGFPLVWSSSFAVSAAQRAMPDVNLLTMTENLETARYINDAVSIPVIADADNGYGNVVNVVRTVEEYERAGVAGICMEDNIFPKKCSLYPGMRRELLSVEEFAGKIRAAVKTRRDPGFRGDRAGGGPHRGLGHEGGAPARPCLCGRRGRHDPHALEVQDGGGGAGVHAPLGAAHPGGGGAHSLPLRDLRGAGRARG